ncbi:MAG: hypothetical protein U0175_21095 [Caldilineaceae bacterium]
MKTKKQVEVKRKGWLGTISDLLFPESARYTADTSAWTGIASVASQIRNGLQARNYEFDQVRHEVTGEQRGAIWLVGRNRQALQHLFAALLQQSITADSTSVAETITDNPHLAGLFTLFTLPNAQADSESGVSSTLGWQEEQDDSWRTAKVLNEAADSDCVLYVCAGDMGWRNVDSQWSARLRNQGATLIPVLVAQDEAAMQPQVEAIRLRLGLRPFVIATAETVHQAQPTQLSALPSQLLQHILLLCPRLAIPLAQEIPALRPQIVRRVVRQGALLTALLGAEPVPLLDLPFQVAVSWKMALQIATIYGRPGLDYRSREMMGTLASNLLARLLCQQTLKLTPFIGWVLSALVSGSSAWLLGRALVRIYEEGHLIELSPDFLQNVTARWQVFCHTSLARLRKLSHPARNDVHSDVLPDLDEATAIPIEWDTANPPWVEEVPPTDQGEEKGVVE